MMPKALGHRSPVADILNGSDSDFEAFWRTAPGQMDWPLDSCCSILRPRAPRAQTVSSRRAPFRKSVLVSTPYPEAGLRDAAQGGIVESGVSKALHDISVRLAVLESQFERFVW